MSVQTPGQTATRRLTRSRKNKKIAGVCGGIAEYLEVDPTVVRVVYILFTVVSAFLPGLVAYIVLAFLIPMPDSPAK
jgi:phage shock protein C